MGQNQLGKTNSMFQDWKIYTNEQRTFINSKTNQQAQQHLITLKKTQQSLLKKRMEDHHNFIAKILYYEPIQKNKITPDEAKYYVYTQKLYPLCNQLWVPINSALSILKGYRRLSSTYGLMRIRQDMIKVNKKKQIKVWINKNIIKNQIAYKAQNQQQMLVDIVKIIMEFDSQTGSLMVNCFTLNQAINNILQSISQSKSALHFSSRTNKKQDKPKLYQKQASLGNNKNNVRSTKQTEDDSIRPFNENSINQISTNELLTPTQQKQPPINYLQGVSTLKSPTYINLNKMNESPSKIQVNLRKQKNDNTTNSFNYSQPNNSQKQSSIQFNNTQPQLGKLSGIARQYKPIQYRNQNNLQQIQNYNSVTRIPNQNNQKLVKQNNKHKQIILYKPYPPGRKSNLSKTDLQQLQNNSNQPINIIPQNQKITTQNIRNQNSDKTGPRQFLQLQQPQLLKTNFLHQNFNLIHFDSTRTKTQQFYTSSAINATQKRLKTNFVNTNTFNQKSPITQNSSNQIKNTSDQISKDQGQNKNIVQNIYYKSPQIIDNQIKKQKQIIKTQPPQDQRRQLKLRQAQKIKQQMCNLGIINTNNTKSLISQKSVRDLLIKQRVQEKNKKHAELKSAITKLLNQ